MPAKTYVGMNELFLARRELQQCLQLNPKENIAASIRQTLRQLDKRLSEKNRTRLAVLAAAKASPISQEPNPTSHATSASNAKDVESNVDESGKAENSPDDDQKTAPPAAAVARPSPYRFGKDRVRFDPVKKDQDFP